MKPDAPVTTIGPFSARTRSFRSPIRGTSGAQRSEQRRRVDAGLPPHVRLGAVALVLVRSRVQMSKAAHPDTALHEVQRELGADTAAPHVLFGDDELSRRGD